VPKRVYVSYSPEDDPAALDALTQALTQAGHERERRWVVVQAAIVVVGPSALNSAEVVGEARQLLERQADEWFPIVPLLLDGISLAELRASSFYFLANIQMSTEGTLTDRINATLAAIETPADKEMSQPSANAHHPFTTMRTINAAPAGIAVNSVAFGEVAGKPVAVAGLVNSAVQLWQLRDQSAPVVELRGHTGSVWSVAIGRSGDRDIIVSGSDDQTVRVWDAATGECVHTLTGHGAPVNAVDVRGALVAGGGDDGLVVVWDLTEPLPRPLRESHRLGRPSFGVITDIKFTSDSSELAIACSDGRARVWNIVSDRVWESEEDSEPVMAVAALPPGVYFGSDTGAVHMWAYRRDNDKYVRDVASHPGGVRALAAEMLDSAGTVVSGGKDNLVQVWELASGVGRKLEGHTGTVRGVAIGTLDGKPIIISGGDDGTIRIWGDVTADHVEWLSDSPSDHDLLVRRPLARSIATRLRRMNDDEPGTSFLVHIDGPWGTGKSTLMGFLQKELEPDFTPVHFNAWSEAGVGPAWWALLTSLRTAVGKQRRWPGRMWLRIREAFARLRRVGAPFVLAFIGLLLVAGGIWWFVNPSFTRAQDIFKSAAGILAMIGTVGAGALVASRFLLWDSARGARLFEQHNTNPMLEVTRHFGWLMARSKKPVVFFIDDLDRCPDTYVVELLDNVQTLVRDASKRSAHFVVSADGAWIRTSYEQAYEKFTAAVSAPGQPLGYLFLDKFFQLRIPVPSIDAPRQQQYLRELLRGPVAPTQELAAEEGRVRHQLTQSTTEAQVVKTLQSASAEVRDRVAGTALDQLSTPAAMAATEHSLQRFAVLLPPNPRTMKRFVNAYSAMRAVRTLEGNPVGVEPLALWTIIEIRWPSLADHLRGHPESIELVGKDDLDTVPEELRVLFGDSALRMIVQQSDFSADVIRLCCGASIPATDR
jgi:WD40 repeat protein